jgi:hypothetical protein
MANRARFWLLLAATVIVGFSIAGQGGDSVSVHNGFIAGQEFRELSERDRCRYAAGLVDGMFLAPLFGAPKRTTFKPKQMPPTSRAEWLEACVEGMTDTQVAAIISKYLADHPARWHESVGPLAYSALIDSCPPLAAHE